MRLTTRGHYGVRAMAQLARAYGKGPQPLSEVASREGLSAAYLEQLIVVLRKAGLVEATRGAHGGYQLSRPPAEISVGDVVRALEGPIAPDGCALDEEGDYSCQRESDCITKNVWLRIRSSIIEALNSTKLADFCEPLDGEAKCAQPVITTTARGDD